MIPIIIAIAGISGAAFIHIYMFLFALTLLPQISLKLTIIETVYALEALQHTLEISHCKHILGDVKKVITCLKLISQVDDPYISPDKRLF